MITVCGKLVFTELDELVNVHHTALLIVDMQNDFCSPGGTDDQQGIDISMYRESIPRIRDVLEAARRIGLLVIHIQNTALPQRKSDSPAQIRFVMKLSRKNVTAGGIQATIENTWGQRFVQELTPLPDELVVKKHRSSAFWGSPLDMILRSNGIKTVVVTGCTTEGCVESTARDAMFNDYYVVIPTDCVASDDRAQHEASLSLMAHRFDLSNSAEIMAVWHKTAELKPTQELLGYSLSGQG